MKLTRAEDEKLCDVLRDCYSAGYRDGYARAVEDLNKELEKGKFFDRFANCLEAEG